MKVNDIQGYYFSDFTLSESKKDNKEVIIQGLLLPKDTISRNGTLYDWESIKQNYKQLEGCNVMFNHEIDGNVTPMGHVIETWLKETSDENGPAGWYYKANLDPDDPRTKKVLRGDLHNVSIQMNADAETESKNGKIYKRAFVKDVLEMSVVNVPGFKDTNIEVQFAEAFKNIKDDININKKENNEDIKNNEDVKKKDIKEEEDVNTSTASGAVAPTKIIKGGDNMSDDEIKNKDVEKPKITVAEEDDEVKNKDMDLVTDTIEKLKEQSDDISLRLSAIEDRLNNLEANKESDETKDDDTIVNDEENEDDKKKEPVKEPIAPVSEKAKIGGIVMENINLESSEDKIYKEAVRSVIK